MEFNLISFILDNLEAAGAIGGYVSLSIIGFALISFAIKKRNNNVSVQIGPRWTHPIIGSFFGSNSWLWGNNCSCLIIQK